MRWGVVGGVVVAAVVVGGAGAYRYHTTPRHHEVAIGSVRASGAVLYVTVMDGAPPCASDLRVAVEESADAVRLAARIRRDGSATCPAILMPHTAQVSLGAPLADRPVVDERSGRQVEIQHP